MTYPSIRAISVGPASGEFTYDTIAYSARAPGGSSFSPINTYFAPGGSKTDFSYALDQIQAETPNAQFVAIVVQWMGSTLDPSTCAVFPSTTLWFGSSVGAFQPTAGGSDSWRVSDLTLADCNAGLLPIPRPDGVDSMYGGTPSDQSIVRAIQEVKARGLKVALYFQMNMSATGQPWRGMCAYASDISSGATSAVNAFLGSATIGMFTRDVANKTVHYSGSRYDYTYRRAVLHYANLCVVAGGVNLFCIGSELRGLEMIRGPAWTPAGTTDVSGNAVWDYPFVAGLSALLNDCRSVFDAAGLVKDLAARQNLLVYSADWSQWTGAPHTVSGRYGVWPHLDSLYANPNLDLVSIDNYMPLSDWTTGDGGLDAHNWRAPAPTSWPVASPNAIGLGLASSPSIYDEDYLASQIEGGEKYHYWYGDYTSAGGLDPNRADVWITAPQGDRLAQSRNAYGAGQELLALKHLRWWWANTHRAVYDSGDGAGLVPRGPVTQWTARAKSMMFMEYGCPSVDRGTNQPNLFPDLSAIGSVASGVPFWAMWNASRSSPLVDKRIVQAYHKVVNTYWSANNETSISGPMIATDLLFAWNADARPFPTFPRRLDLWADGVNWPVSDWLIGKAGVPVAPPAAPPPGAGVYPTFPSVVGKGWSVIFRPRFTTRESGAASGKVTRSATMRFPLYEIELTFDLLRGGLESAEMQTLAGFFKSLGGQASPFWIAPPDLSTMSGLQLGVGDGVTTRFWLLWAAGDYAEPLAGVASADSITQVTLDGAPHSDWSLSSRDNPAIVFATAPAPGSVIAASYSGLFLCRMQDEMIDFSEFAHRLHSLSSLKMQTVKTYDGPLIGVAPSELPQLPGLAYPVVKRPVTQTIVAAHPSGREVRLNLVSTIWEWQLSYEALASDDGSIAPGLGARSLHALLGLFLQCQGGLRTFRYTDPVDNIAVLQIIGSGDGSTTNFTALRSIGAVTETVSYVTALTAVTVDGVAPTSFSLIAPNQIHISPAPASGAVVAATFDYQFICRFVDDSMDFEEFASNIWSAKSVKFRSVLQ